MTLIFGCTTANEIAKAAREAEFLIGLNTPANDDGSYSEEQSNLHMSMEDLEAAKIELTYWQDQVYSRQEEVYRAKAKYTQSILKGDTP